MKSAAVLVIMWWNSAGTITSIAVDMPTLTGCNAEVTRLAKTPPPKGPPGASLAAFCIERK